MKHQRKAPTWQRIFCGLLGVAAIGLLARSLLSGVPGPLDHTAQQLLAASGGYLFSHIALTGRLPARMQHKVKKGRSRN